MKKCIIGFLCALPLLALSACTGIEFGVPETVTIDGITYRSDFYGEMFPRFSQAGEVGSESLQDEIVFEVGNHKFRRVEFSGHDWVHCNGGGITGGIVWCAEDEWEQTRDYYADSANFTYYCSGKPYATVADGEYPQIDPQKYDELLAFGEEYGYEPFDSRSNERAEQITYRLPAEAFDKNIRFTKSSNDGYFTMGGNHNYFIYDGKLLFVFYHDGGARNGGIKEVVVIDVPEELGPHFIDLLAQYKE